MKRCYKCKTEKPLDDFYKTKANSDGLDSKCKTCRNAYYKEYSQKNKEKISKRQANWYIRTHEEK